MKKSLLITLIVVWFLAACAPVAPAPTPAAIQSTVETPAQAPTVVPTQASQPTAAPTEAPAPTQAASLTLTDNAWQWVAFTSPVDQFKVEQPESYQLTFQDDGTVAIKADCNNAGGTYTADDSSLTIEVGPMTMAACPDGSRGDQFIKLLSGAAKYFFVDNALFINLYADGGTMRFDPPGQTATAADSAAADQAAQAAAVAAALTGNPWKWAAFSSATEGVTVETPANYRVTFKDDGTVEIKADCNNAFGTYTLDGVNITIEIGPSTLAACPGASRSEQFLRLLGDAAQALPVEGKLYMPLKTEGSTLVFDAVITTVADLCGEKALAVNKIEDTLDPEISAALDDALVSFLQAGTRSAPGVSMLVITPQGRYFKSAGVADVTTCAPLPADSPFQIGSNTKMMTSAMIFQLQEEGVLSTTDLLSKWLPDLAAQLPYGDQITIDMMLTHTSGLHDYFDVPTKDGTTIEGGAKDKAMLTRNFTPEELVQVVADSGLSYFGPGAEGQWHYSNTGYALLGLIIEKATGRSYEENLRTRIFEPLGLKQTYLLTGQPKPGTLPHAYYQPPFDYTTDEWNASQGWAAGAVVSTPDEFATFLKALFTGKLFKQPTTLDLMKAHTAAGVDALGKGTVYAHGMFDNQGVLGHGGQTLGFQSDGGYIPDKDVTIVMWSNSATSAVNRLAVPALAGIVLGQGTAATTGGTRDSSGQTPAAGKPAYVTDLEAAYGAPSQAGFGSAVFYEPLQPTDDLTQKALDKYNYFVGELWERWGADAWMGPWKEVYVRPTGAKPDIVAELRGITDQDAAISAPMILDSVQDAEKARAALAAAYDDPAVTELRVFNLGDGGAMSGILVAGRRGAAREAAFLVFLMD
jgi:D-alanyl-D-alanine carboxypeptidase